MSKAEGFKKWFIEHQGHSSQLRVAYEAIEELEGALSFACEKDDGWVEIDSAEDVDCDCEILLYDGCDYYLDCVDIDADTGVVFFANGTSQATHYKLNTPPKSAK